jgi:DegV family protein with EDD domain
MHNIGVITDSTCDIPQETIDQYGIKVVSHYILWGEREFIDRVTLQPLEFYQKLETENVKPTTSQATVEDFVKKYEEAVLEGAKELIVLTVSSAMSGAYQMALNAAKLVNVPVSVVDSKGPTMTLGWQVLEAVRKRDLGHDVKAILESVDAVRRNLVQIVGMESMEYLQHGGRIGDAAKWIGTKLQIKPVVSINHETGRVEPAGLARTHKGIVDMIYKKFLDGLRGDGPLHVAVLHGNAPAAVEKLAEKVQTELHPVEMLVNMTGPVLGINTGPRALALCGYRE